MKNKKKYPEIKVDSVQDYINKVDEIAKKWDLKGVFSPWFRGQSDYNQKLTPSIFRSYTNRGRKKYYSHADEFWMATMFRNRASGLENSPEYGRIDKWLFLMQHHGLPTRLLDWTESSFCALFFTIRNYYKKKKNKIKDIGIWMMNPSTLLELHYYEVDGKKVMLEKGFHSTFGNDVGLANFRYTFNQNGALTYIGKSGSFYVLADPPTPIGTPYLTEYPLPIQPVYIHKRISTQKSVFTIHGNLKDDFEKIFWDLGKQNSFIKFIFSKDKIPEIINFLNIAGISDFTVFPDYNGLAEELKKRFQK